MSDQISVSDRGLAYGDGLFETMRVVDQKIPLLSYHRARLLASAETLALALSLDRLEQGLVQALTWIAQQQIRQSTIKLIVTRPGQSAGYRWAQMEPANILLRASELSVADAPSTLRAKVCDYVLPVSPVLAGIKHLCRLDQVMASRELGEDDDEGILLDAEGCLAEGISNNIFLVKGTELATPMMPSLGVKGVMRNFIMTLSHELPSTQIVEREILVSELETADEIILTNAVRGVRNLTEIRGRWVAKETDTGDMLRRLLCEKLAPGFTSF